MLLRSANTGLSAALSKTRQVITWKRDHVLNDSLVSGEMVWKQNVISVSLIFLFLFDMKLHEPRNDCQVCKQT